MQQGLPGVIGAARNYIGIHGFSAFFAQSFRSLRKGSLFPYLKRIWVGVPEIERVAWRGDAQADQIELADTAQTEPTADVGAAQPVVHDTVERMFYARFPNLNPMRFYPVPKSDRRLNLVTDSISSSSLFGGVGTSLIFGALLAEKAGAELRILTRIEPPERKNLGFVLEANGIKIPNKVSFEFFPRERTHPIDIGANDAFLSTSWWTTESLSDVVPKSSIVYILQEDERMFYAGGDEQLLCWHRLADDEIMKVVNTRLLFDHFSSQKVLAADAGHVFFEPAFSEAIYSAGEEPRKGGKRKLLFYARPGHPRNLYYLGLQVIDRAVSSGLIDPDEWEIIFVGTESPEVLLGGRVVPTVVSGMNWSEYGEFLRGIDLGLSLMATPHPSYPPLDIAASGGVVVTNAYGNKTDLSNYSANIIVRPPTIEGLLDGIDAGVKLMRNDSRRLKNYKSGKLARQWQDTLDKAVDASLQRIWSGV